MAGGNSDKLQDVGLLILRLGLGLVVLYYGLQMAFGAFGGHGFQAQLTIFEVEKNIPRWLGIMAIVALSAGSFGIIFGLLTRLAAFGLACTMWGATYFGFGHNGGFYGLQTGNPSLPSYTLYPAALAFMATALIFTGSGAFALDPKVFKRGK